MKGIEFFKEFSSNFFCVYSVFLIGILAFLKRFAGLFVQQMGYD